MANQIPQWLVVQYRRARVNGWIPHFRAAAARHGFTTEDVLALASRESNMQNIKGDYHDGKYHGFSLLQLDIGSHKKWIESGEWTDATKAIYKGVAALAEKRSIINTASKQSLCKIKFRSGKTATFTPKQYSGSQLRQLTLASYNCGMAAYYHFSIGNPIDRGTTGKNYSADVIERSKHFKTLLASEASSQSVIAIVETQPSVDPAPIITPDPNAAITATVDFDHVSSKVTQNAELIQSPTVKGVAAKAGGKIALGLGSIWGTTEGKIALVLSGLIIAGVLGWTIYHYRVWLSAFFKGGYKWMFSK